MSSQTARKRSDSLWIGLTGGLAGGKSTVARILAEAGCRVFDSDRLVAELYQPGEAGTEVVSALFGDEFLNAQGAVDPAKLAAKVFSESQALAALEERIHPLVGERFSAAAQEASGLVVLEGTLLVEAGFGALFDHMVTVEAPESIRLQRAIARGLSEHDARARLAAQGSGAARRAEADSIIENEGTLEELEAQVLALHRDWSEQLSGRPTSL